ncbi:MAG: hypothetical protein IT462_04360 [Planctomycetes bacterium]|nr:hypothetical protein [Planctomycetota bacterium]
MKKLTLLLLVLVSVITLAACGGANNTPVNNAPKTDGGHKDHGHGDEHGKMTDLGKKKVGDRDVEVGVDEWKVGKEGVAEVKVSGDKIDVKFWAEQDGKEISPKKTGEWNGDEKLWDCHVELAKAKAGKAKLFVEIGDKKESWDVVVK